MFIQKQIGEKARKKKFRLHMGFMDLEMAYDRDNWEVLWQMLRIYDVRAKLLSGIKRMYVDSSSCIREKQEKVSSLG